MNKALKQSIEGKETEYRIDDAGVMKIIHSKYGASEFHIPFEQIKTNKAFVFEQNKAALGIGFMFSIISIVVFILRFQGEAAPEAFIVWLAIAITAFGFYYKSRVHKLFLETMDGKYIEFKLTSTSHKSVNEFVDRLLKSRNEYLISKYGVLNRNMDYQLQLDNLNWLINNLVITREQYDEKVRELNILFPSSAGNKPIGFITSN